MAKRLSEQQIAAIEYLSLPGKGDMTDAQIAEKVGVSERTIYRWKNDETFYKALSQKIVRGTVDQLPDIMASVSQHIIQGGNAAMLRTLLQAHGLLTEKHEVETKGEGTVDIKSIRDRMERVIADQRNQDTTDIQ